MAAPSDVVTPITTDFFVKGAAQNAITYTTLFKKLSENGGLDTVEGGTQYTFPVEGGLNGVTDTTDGADLSSFLSLDTVDVQASLPWCDKVSRALLTNGMIRRNRGNSALENYKKRAVPKAVRSLLDQGSGSANYDFYNNDGTGAGSPLYGLPAVFKFDTGATGKEATVTSGATYAGLSLEAAGLAATLTNAIDDYVWTPRGINSAATTWTNGGGITVDDVLEQVGYAQQQITFDPSDPDQRPDTVVADKSSFLILRQAIEQKQNIYINTPGKPGQGGAEWAVGTSPDSLWYSGLYCCWDASISTAQLNVLNMNRIKLVCQKGEDVNTTGESVMRGESMGISLEFMTDLIFQSRTRGTLITLAGQYQINPRFQAVIQDFS